MRSFPRCIRPVKRKWCSRSAGQEDRRGKERQTEWRRPRFSGGSQPAAGQNPIRLYRYADAPAGVLFRRYACRALSVVQGHRSTSPSAGCWEGASGVSGSSLFRLIRRQGGAAARLSAKHGSFGSGMDSTFALALKIREGYQGREGKKRIRHTGWRLSGLPRIGQKICVRVPLLPHVHPNLTEGLPCLLKTRQERMAQRHHAGAFGPYWRFPCCPFRCPPLFPERLSRPLPKRPFPRNPRSPDLRPS